MNFHSPEWLYAGLAAAVLVLIVYRISGASRKRLLSEFASARLLPKLSCNFSPVKYFVKRALFLFGVVLVFIAMARPQWGYKWEETKTRGIDIIFAIDTSRSMLAEDVSPNRLERSKLAVMDLVNVLKGDKIGIVAVIALAAVFYFAVLFAVGGVKKQDVLLMPKGEKIAKLLNLK